VVGTEAYGSSRLFTWTDGTTGVVATVRADENEHNLEQLALLEKKVLQICKKNVGLLSGHIICNRRGSSEVFQNWKNLQCFSSLK
jgi:hypothetical protein